MSDEAIPQDENVAGEPKTQKADDDSRWRMFFWPMMALLVIAAFFLRDQLGTGSDGTKAEGVGKSMNRVQLIGLLDDELSLATEDLKNRVTLINFWGYWCPPCVAEMPELLELRDEFSRDDRFQFVSVACHAVPNKPEVLKEATAKFLDSRDYDLPVYTDPAGSTRLAVAQMNGGGELIAYPTTVLVGPDGVVRAIWVGYSPSVIRQQKSEIAKLLNAAG